MAPDKRTIGMGTPRSLVRCATPYTQRKKLILHIKQPAMAKLTSLDDLRSLLPADAAAPRQEHKVPAPQVGYDGKQQRLDVALDSRRRKGKTVTLVTGFQARPGELEAIAQSLKRACGAGGKAGDNEIELQGDHRAKVVERLKALGYMVRLR